MQHTQRLYDHTECYATPLCRAPALRMERRLAPECCPHPDGNIASAAWPCSATG